MGDKAGEVAFGVTNLIALAVNLPSMAKGALKLGQGAINFFKEGEGIAKIGASISGIGKNVSSFLDEGKAAFKALGEVGANKLDNFLESVKDVKNNIGKTLEEIKVNIENIGPKLAYELKGDGTNHYKFDFIDNRITNTSDNYKFSGINEVEDVANEGSKLKLKFNNVGEYYSYINDIGKRIDINSEQKLALIQEAYEALGNDKGDITCISDIKYLKPEGFGANGRPIVDWPEKMGFNVDSITGITKGNPLPDTWDRIGVIGGENFTTLPSDGEIFTYDERAIPYLENIQARHVGSFNNNNYFDVIDAIKNNDINKLNDIMKSNAKNIVSVIEFKDLKSNYMEYIERVKSQVGNIDATYGLKGTAAPWKSNGEIYMKGGAEQIVTPLTGELLERLGVLEIKY